MRAETWIGKVPRLDRRPETMARGQEASGERRVWCRRRWGAGPAADPPFIGLRCGLGSVLPQLRFSRVNCVTQFSAEVIGSLKLQFLPRPCSSFTQWLCIQGQSHRGAALNPTPIYSHPHPIYSHPHPHPPSPATWKKRVTVFSVSCSQGICCFPCDTQTNKPGTVHLFCFC